MWAPRHTEQCNPTHILLCVLCELCVKSDFSRKARKARKGRSYRVMMAHGLLPYLLQVCVLMNQTTITSEISTRLVITERSNLKSVPHRETRLYLWRTDLAMRDPGVRRIHFSVQLRDQSCGVVLCFRHASICYRTSRGGGDNCFSSSKQEIRSWIGQRNVNRMSARQALTSRSTATVL